MAVSAAPSIEVVLSASALGASAPAPAHLRRAPAHLRRAPERAGEGLEVAGEGLELVERDDSLIALTLDDLPTSPMQSQSGQSDVLGRHIDLQTLSRDLQTFSRDLQTFSAAVR